jgi:hypothetical protein
MYVIALPRKFHRGDACLYRSRDIQPVSTVRGDELDHSNGIFIRKVWPSGETS